MNGRGFQQAALAGKFVRDNFALAAVWSSDLTRCSQTAEALGLPYIPTRDLREIQFGLWEGMSWTKIFDSNADLAASWVAGDPDFQAPGGERIRDLVARAGRFVNSSGALDSSGDVAFVTHGGTARALIVALLGLPVDSTARFYVGNCSVSVIDVTDGYARLERLNYTGHLDGSSLAPVDTRPGTRLPL